MAPGQKRKLALPSTLLSELDVQQPRAGGTGRNRSRAPSRKELRRTQRVQKKQSRRPQQAQPSHRTPTSAANPRTGTKSSKPATSRATTRHDTEDDEFSEEGSDEEEDDDNDIFDEEDESEDDSFGLGSDSEMESADETRKQPSKSARQKLAMDDKEIAELERKLGMKGRKSLPKAFDEDGLGDLLDGLDGNDQEDGASSKRKRNSEADEWLAQKRRKAEAAASAAAQVPTNDGIDRDESDGASGSEDWDSGEEEFDDVDEDEDHDEDADGFDGFSEDESVKPAQAPRENPYVAPTTNVAKYIPPSLRKQSQTSTEVEAQLRRRVQGLINRLTNDNMIGITKEFLALYTNNPRQLVTSSLVDTVLALVCSPEKRPDAFFTMTAGFVAAIHRAAGMAVSAYFLQQIVETFNKHYEAASGDHSDAASKHLVTLLAELYSMQVVGCNLIFDFVRLFLRPLSELNTELLLKIIQLCGPSLRREDPHALRDIVSSIKSDSLAGASVRTSFMVDEMKKLQSNKTKAVARNKDIADQRSQIKKRIGTLEGSRDIQPLRIGLKDIQNADKAGKWWLVGASWTGTQAGADESHLGKKQRSEMGKEEEEDDAFVDDDDLGVPDLWGLAKQQGFNTEVRQRIFVALHAATDYENADLLIRNLRLNKHQRKEIPEVVVRSAERQQAYNHYYTLVAGRLCGQNKELAFQFRRSLTVRFARMGEEIDMAGGEGDGGGGYYDADEAEDYDMRWLYNAARLYGSLAAGRQLRLADALKHRSLVALQDKPRMFVEVMLLTVLQEVPSPSPSSGGEDDGDGGDKNRSHAAMRDVLGGVDRDLGRGLQYFVRKTLRRTDLLKDKRERKLIRRRCDELDATLDAMLAAVDPVS